MQRTVERAYKAGCYTLYDIKLLIKVDLLTNEYLKEITSFGFYLSEMGDGD